MVRGLPAMKFHVLVARFAKVFMGSRIGMLVKQLQFYIWWYRLQKSIETQIFLSNGMVFYFNTNVWTQPTEESRDRALAVCWGGRPPDRCSAGVSRRRAGLFLTHVVTPLQMGGGYLIPPERGGGQIPSLISSVGGVAPVAVEKKPADGHFTGPVPPPPPDCRHGGFRLSLSCD